MMAESISTRVSVDGISTSGGAGINTPVHRVESLDTLDQVMIPEETAMAFEPLDIMENDDVKQTMVSTTTTTTISETRTTTTTTRDWGHIQNIIQTVTYFIMFIFFGFCNSIVGPTLGQLSNNSHTKMEQMGWIFTCKGLGAVIGGVIGGKAYDFFQARSMRAAHLYLVVSNVCLAGCIALIPFLRSMGTLLTVFFLFGVFVGQVNMGVNILCMWTWKEKVTPIILALSCIAGVGSFLGPLFLTTGATFQLTYWLTGVMVFAASATMFVGQLPSFLLSKNQNNNNHMLVKEEQEEEEQQVEQVEEEEQIKEEEQSSSKGKFNLLLSKSRDLRIAAVVGLALFGSVALESSFGGLAFTYFEAKKLAANAKQNALLISVFWISITVTRLVAALISSVVRPAILLTVNITLCFVSVIMFLLLPSGAPAALVWIATILLGIGLSSQFPTAMSFPTSSMNVKVTGIMSSIMMIIASSAEMTVPVIATKCFGRFGVSSLFWILLAVCVVGAIAYTMLFVWAFTLSKQKTVTELQQQQQMPVAGDEEQEDEKECQV